MKLGQPHTKIYYIFFGLDDMDDVYCECCGKMAVDIHHIRGRGIMGGPKKANDIKNLMALCRSCHDRFGDIGKFREELIQRHLVVMINHLKKCA